MEILLNCIFILNCIFFCHGVSLLEQLEHVIQRRRENLGLGSLPSRRIGVLSRGEDTILGAPDIPAHLPEAEAILPGHTLIRPAFGMLKSALSFPHRDLEDGSGVYGNFNMLGLRYGNKKDRVLNTGFRRIMQNTPESIMKMSKIAFARYKLLGMLGKADTPEQFKLIKQIL